MKTLISTYQSNTKVKSMKSGGFDGSGADKGERPVMLLQDYSIVSQHSQVGTDHLCLFDHQHGNECQ